MTTLRDLGLQGGFVTVDPSACENSFSWGSW